MELSRELLKQFAQIANGNSNKRQNTSTYMNATTVVSDGVKYVRIDGSDQLTPVSETMGIQDGDRVLVTIEDHRATVIGNYTYPADARTANNALTAAGQASEEIANLSAIAITTTNLSANLAVFGYLTAAEANIAYAQITELNALQASFDTLEAKAITTDTLDAESAELGYIKSDEIEATYATLAQLESTNAKIENLEAGRITADEIIAAVAEVGYIKAEDITSDSGSFNYLSSSNLNTTYATVVSLNALQGSFNTLNAKAITTDNLSAKVATLGYIKAEDITSDSGSFNYLSSSNLNTTYATVVSLNALQGSFNTLNAKAITTDNLSAKVATLGYIKAEDITSDSGSFNYLSSSNLNTTYATVVALEAANAEIIDIRAKAITTDNLSAKVATLGYLLADDLEAEVGEFGYLKADDAKITYANIDFSNIDSAAMEYFYANSGLIKDVTIGDGTITGHLVGVTISGDLIEGNTIVAEKLVIKGDDGLYYKLNTDGETVETEQTEYNSLSGSVITAKSVTAEKIKVDDLVAFDATIGGFKITENSIYSGVKSSVDNTTRGIYQDNDGQIALGDASNYLKYYKVSDDKYRLEISADSMIISSSSKSVESAITDMEELVNSANDNATNALSAVEDLEARANSGEFKGEDATTLRIDSSRGTVFKNSEVSTVLSVVIYKGSKRITDITALREEYGSGAYIEWSWQRLNETAFGTILSTDTRIGNDGFTFTLSPDDVDTKVVFMCQLITE